MVETFHIKEVALMYLGALLNVMQKLGQMSVCPLQTPAQSFTGHTTIFARKVHL